MRAVRLTWTIGGLGLVLCGVIGMMQYALPYAGSVLAPTRELVFAAAVVLFAVGVTKEASVVARRPLGVIALVVLALWPLAMRLAEPLLPTMDAATFDAGLDAYRAAESALTTVFYVDLLVSLSAALIAVVQIARARTVPGVWRWAPLWALLVSVAAGVVVPLLLAAAAPTGDQNLAGVATVLGALGPLAKTLGLGVVALVLASQVRDGVVEVYRSA